MWPKSSGTSKIPFSAVFNVRHSRLAVIQGTRFHLHLIRDSPPMPAALTTPEAFISHWQ